MKLGWLKEKLVKVGLWALRILVREGKEEIAKFMVEQVIEDPKIPLVKDVGDFVRKNFPLG